VHISFVDIVIIIQLLTVLKLHVLHAFGAVWATYRVPRLPDGLQRGVVKRQGDGRARKGDDLAVYLELARACSLLIIQLIETRVGVLNLLCREQGGQRPLQKVF
jgi:hypothetical protein